MLFVFGYFDPEKILIDNETKESRGDLTDILAQENNCRRQQCSRVPTYPTDACAGTDRAMWHTINRI